MKKILYILLLAYTLTGCEDFLNQLPEDTLSPDAYYNDTKELMTGLSGCYKLLQNIYSPVEMTKVLELMSDDAKDPRNTDVFHVFRKTNANSQTNIWTHNYKMIYNCNALLNILATYNGATETDRREAQAIEGECHFLRALAYFNLVRIYGDVPMVTELFANPTDAFGIGRTPVNEIYTKVVIPDLENAIANCYPKGAKELIGSEARATKGSALMMLGKVYMTMNNYAEAEKVLQRLIINKEGGEYGLMPTMHDVFQPENKFNKESIFEVNFNVSGGQACYYFQIMINDIAIRYGTTYNSAYQAEHNLMREFVKYNEDVRYKSTLDSGYVPNASPYIQAFPVKFAPEGSMRAAVKNTGTDNNFMVYRYADALLMYAECLMKSGNKVEAIKYINMVRIRSEMESLPNDHPLDIYWILHERRMELTFEGHRYFDLVRTGKAIEIISKDLMTVCDLDDKPTLEPIQEYQLLLPIPTAQIEIDQTLVQNKGY
ncbi:RagB/SusD family nutrient uptake outer membrane protein [Parabacteroides chinchillae]